MHRERFVFFTMARLQGLCLVVIAALYGGCHAQKIIRTLMPMTLMESCPTGGCTYEETTSTCVDDLNALLLLARALESDKAVYANKGIDINGLLDNLIRALVYIATHHGGKGPSSHGSYPSHSPGNTGTNKDPLIDLHLLGSGKDNVAALGVAGTQVLGVGIGNGDDGKGTGTSNHQSTSGMTGTVSAVSGAVSSITGTASGTTGSVSAVSGAVSGVTGTTNGTTGTVSGVAGAVSGVTGTTNGTTGTVSGVAGAVSGVTGTTSGMTGAVSGVSGAVAGVTGGSMS